MKKTTVWVITGLVLVLALGISVYSMKIGGAQKDISNGSDLAGSVVQGGAKTPPSALDLGITQYEKLHGVTISQERKKVIRSTYDDVNYVTTKCPTVYDLLKQKDIESNISQQQLATTEFNNCVKANPTDTRLNNIAAKVFQYNKTIASNPRPQMVVIWAIIDGIGCALGNIWSCIGFVGDIIGMIS